MRRLLFIIAGASVGFVAAALLPMWPLLYGDLGRNVFLPRALRYPDDLDQWVGPLMILAFSVALGLIGARKLDDFLRRRKEAKRHLCQKCSYNLTGNTSGVCPECGTPVAKEPARKSPRPV